MDEAVPNYRQEFLRSPQHAVLAILTLGLGFLSASLLGIVAGVTVLQNPLFSPLVIAGTVIILMGIDGILIGALDLVRAFQGGGLSIGIVGVVNVLVGFFLLSDPLGMAIALPVFIGLVAIIGGIASIWMAFRVRAVQAA
jgi:uncharacterized membrane protein HdeD (DUF308 family)